MMLVSGELPLWFQCCGLSLLALLFVVVMYALDGKGKRT